MNDFLKTLMNIRSLRAVLRELSYEQLVEAKDKFELNACKNWLSLPSC